VKAVPSYDSLTYLPNPVVQDNTFRVQEPLAMSVPTFETAKEHLPEPLWDGHGSEIACYWDCWKKMFLHIAPANENNHFLYHCINTVFNGNVFLWDTVMSAQYAKYGSRSFSVGGSFDNFYARQHPDGFICREVSLVDGSETWSRHDPSSTGPDIFAWGEWELYRLHGDTERLKLVLPALLGYFYWMRAYRRWPDGGRWYSGWGSGIDNQMRQHFNALPFGVNPDESGDLPVQCHWFLPGEMTWVDATAHALLSADVLVKMIQETGMYQEHLELLQTERELLRHIIHGTLWNEDLGFYVDRQGNGELSSMKTVAAYWVLLTEDVPKDRVARMVEHLENPNEFFRKHCVPTVSADDRSYVPTGGYWRGGVWPPTNYMVVRALTKQGYHDLAHRIALNHIENVTEVFEKTGTVWENYAPEAATPGDQAKPDMLGWSGLGPIALLIEAILGIEVDAPNNVIVYRPFLLEEHGISNLVIGQDAVVSLACAKRQSQADYPQVRFRCSGAQPFTLVVSHGTS
jgi:hypothetical protein